MIRIFIGIVKCGAWGCFDEFNRLKEDQLSAISQQIQTIQDAIKMKVSPIQLLGRNIDVNFNSGIFVTLNPAGKGYGELGIVSGTFVLFYVSFSYIFIYIYLYIYICMTIVL
jgi:hypothetical protein